MIEGEGEHPVELVEGPFAPRAEHLEQDLRIAPPTKHRSLSLEFLPQALKVTIPNIVNTYIGLFKDTSLLLIVGIFDFLKAIETARIDPQWAAPNTSPTGYAFAAIVYFIFCYGMARYAKAMEVRLAVADKR
jgi:general L-amino acid transport system permease protein